ncbi:MAG TPA: phosphate signaling complex protein PhoU [Anaeromyxobacteraceae bacterium]|jgi:phosphate transport system protein
MSKNHTARVYDQELKDLRERLLAMGGRVESQLAGAVRAVAERDADLAMRVKRADADVNRIEVEIDDACRHILALRQPAASDLRFIATALKIVVDLERMGDLTVNIAERAIDLAQAPPLPPLHDLETLAGLAESQLRKALDALVRADVDRAREVIEGDGLLDALYLKIFNELLQLMMEDSRAIRRATALMFAAKHLERFGDHCINLAEMVVYMVQGTDVRHPRSRGLAPR